MWHATRWCLGLLVAAASLACGPTQPQPPAAAPDWRATAEAAASEIHAALPRQRPGHGTTDYPGHAEGDVPKAYAMVLLAEVERLGRPWRAAQANLARTAGEWLLAHADSNGDGVIGWGLPVAWDAYDDGSVNPAHTEYTISTAIVIDALLTWAERDAQAPRARIRARVHAAIVPYLGPTISSPSGMAPYSLAPADRAYDTFNPAAYLAGQIQRASLIVDDHRERERYAAAADASMRVLLQHRQLAPGSGHWFWHYSVQQALPNDLPHAGYVIDGIRAYIEYSGRLAAQFDWYAVLGHLGDFKGEVGAAGEVRAFPVFRKDLTLAARSYDLGFALHLACTETRTAALVPWLLGAVKEYRTAQARYLKHPAGAPAHGDAAPALVINEYEAYLYRGLTSCALAPASSATSPALAVTRLAATEQAAAHARELAGRPSAAGAVSAAGLAAAAGAAGAAGVAGAAGEDRRLVVPLLPADAGLVSFDAVLRAQVTRPDGQRLVVAAPGVPVRVLTEGDATYMFHRRHPDDRLTLLRYERERLVCRQAVEHGDDATAVAMLRAATLHGGRLHAVVYQNPSQANWHMAWDTTTPCPGRVGGTHALPTLGEPAGSTYEMIPSLHFHADTAAGHRLWLAGGNVQMEVGAAGLTALTLVPGCRHILESAVTRRGLAHLCVSALPDARTQARLPVIVAPEGVPAPAVDATRGVPWRLRYSLGALQIDHAASARQLRQLLRRDLAQTAPGGWMEYGINNDEGRIPWSQIYYLNGLFDLLDLARRDTRLLELFGPLLPEVRLRLEQEMRLLDRHVAEGRHRTRAFTVDRSRALFGVQTGRLLLAMQRYRSEWPEAPPLASHGPLRHAVQRLEDHIEVLATEGEEARWIPPGRHHLRWPRGSKFYFDGLPVPYNHQNEWAYAVLATADAATPPEVLKAATDVLQHFVDRIAPGASLPADGAWDYWWGHAYDGWTEQDSRSVNTPRYGGDRIKAWISFRTIDAMALVAGAPRLGTKESANARASAASLLERGLLYPWGNHALVHETQAIHLARAVAQEYSRTSAPWELSNAVWSLSVLAAAWRQP